MALTSRQRALLVIGLGGTIGAVSSLLAYGYVQQLLDETRTELSANNRMTSVAVAAHALPWGTVLSSDAVRVVSFPSESVPDGTFPSSDELIGRVLLTPLTSQEPILVSKLAPTDVTTGGIAAVTHPEKRAMAIKVDDVTGVGGILKPGDRVDVLTTMSRVLNGGEPTTKLVLADIMVLSTGLDASTGKEEESLLSGRKASRTPPTVVTLEVAPHEAERLSLASMEGKVHLALRNPRSAATVVTPGATVSSLFGDQRSDPQRTSETVSRQRRIVRDRPSDGMIRTSAREQAHASSAKPTADASTTVGTLPRLQPYVHSQAAVTTGAEAGGALAPPDSTGPNRPDETRTPARTSTGDREGNIVAATPVQDGFIAETAMHPPTVSVEVIRGVSRTEVKF
ncbi:MAG: Flp pilus assembly protein CpaB [Nitrospira sp.]|nr:Flp pilus assembly protein CpaB [Fimbriimonadaceae bacterium]MBX3346795.1 Flp pilus assembly protein CpaB [Nitrospira sp.]